MQKRKESPKTLKTKVPPKIKIDFIKQFAAIERKLYRDRIKVWRRLDNQPEGIRDIQFWFDIQKLEKEYESKRIDLLKEKWTKFCNLKGIKRYRIKELISYPNLELRNPCIPAKEEESKT